jgi:hypothetical protein
LKVETGVQLTQCSWVWSIRINTDFQVKDSEGKWGYFKLRHNSEGVILVLYFQAVNVAVAILVPVLTFHSRAAPPTPKLPAMMGKIAVAACTAIRWFPPHLAPFALPFQNCEGYQADPDTNGVLIGFQKKI